MNNERGQILILTALSIVVLLGVAALTIDGGFMYDKRNKLYQAADLAAKSGAIEYRRNNGVSQGELENFADRAFNTHAFTTTRQSGTVTAVVTHPPDDGPYSGNNDYVEVEAWQPTNTFFGAMLGIASMTPKVRAVAGAGASSNCITLLNPPSGDLSISNPVGYITGLTCSINTGGDIDNDGTITAASVSAASCTGCDSSTFHQTNIPPSDPLASLPTPTAADCNNGSPHSSGTLVISGPTNLTPGTYNDIKFESPGAAITLASGIYCIMGTIYPKNPGQDTVIDGSAGVMIYIGPSGQWDLGSNHVDVTLNAMTSGTYEGVIFFQDRSNSNTVTLTKNHGPYNVNGAFYAPNATIAGKNANWAPTNFCGLMVAGGMDFDKPTLTMDMSCYDFGTIFQTVSLAE